MTNLITRLKELEARIYAADGHEGHKHLRPFLDELANAWPKLAAIVEAAEAYDQCPGGRFANKLSLRFKLRRALAALEGDSE